MKIISHRGKINISKNSENNLEAINNFMDSNIEMIEIDIQLTKDKNIILYHDKNIKINNYCCGLFKNTKNIIDLDKETLIEQELIYLKDALDLIKGEREIYLDIKNENLQDNEYKLFFEILLKLLDEYILKYKCERSTIYLASFYEKYASFISNIPVEYKKGIILNKENLDFLKNNYSVKNFPFDFISIDYDLLDNEIIKNYFNKAIIFCWTVNDNNSFSNIINNYNINGIVTDYPVKFLNLTKFL